MIHLPEVLLLFLIALPALTAAFIILIPRFDMASVHQIVTTILAFWLGILALATHELHINKQNLIFSLQFNLWIEQGDAFYFLLSELQIILLFAMGLSLLGFFVLNKTIIEQNGLLFSSFTLLLLSLSTLTILTTLNQVSIIIANISLILFLFLVAHYGGSQKGKALFISTIFFLSIDLASIIVLFLPQKIWNIHGFYLFWILIFPALARLLIPFLSPFSRAIFKNSPIEIYVLFISFILPVGAALLFQFKNVLAFYQTHLNFNFFISLLALCSLIFSALWPIQEKDPRQVGIDLLVFYNAIFMLLILESTSNGQLFIAASLFFCSILCVSFTLYVGNLIFIEHQHQQKNIVLNQLWFVSLMLWLGIPGIGMGTSLWAALMHLFSLKLNSSYIGFWLVAFIIFAVALIHNYARYLTTPKNVSSIILHPSDLFISSKETWIAFVVTFILCLFVSTYLTTLGV